MRIDKFLKVSRIIKRRTIAKEICENGRVFVNGKPAKPSEEVKINDVLELNLNARQVKVKVLELRENARIEEADKMYEIINNNK
ncbi:MAG: RNA-binding S4 domain-containing protein [Bacilli bacterium]